MQDDSAARKNATRPCDTLVRRTPMHPCHCACVEPYCAGSKGSVDVGVQLTMPENSKQVQANAKKVKVPPLPMVHQFDFTYRCCDYQYRSCDNPYHLLRLQDGEGRHKRCGPTPPQACTADRPCVCCTGQAPSSTHSAHARTPSVYGAELPAGNTSRLVSTSRTPQCLRARRVAGAGRRGREQARC